MRTFIVSATLVCAFLTASCSPRLIIVPTGAMQPTIKIGGYVVADKTAYSSGQAIKRFDIVIHKLPLQKESKRMGLDENTQFVFRVIGLGGEKVEVKKGQVFINDVLLDETFEKNSSDDNFGPLTVPDNEFFLMGDNRPESWDSRFWKPSTIKREDVLGKVVTIL